MFTEEKIRQVMQQYMEHSYPDLCYHAVQNFNALLKEMDNNELKASEAVYLILQLVRTSVYSDDQLSDKEKQFVKDVFADSVEKYILNAFESRKQQAEMESAVRMLFRALPPQGRGYALNLVSAFIAVDHRLDQKEVQFLSGLLNG